MTAAHAYVPGAIGCAVCGGQRQASAHEPASVPPSPEEMADAALASITLPQEAPAVVWTAGCRMGVSLERTRAASREQELVAEVERLRGLLADEDHPDRYRLR